MVEFFTIMLYIERYADLDDRMLEIGAGTGRYSYALAQQGYRVDAMDEEAFKLYMKYHFATCERRDMLGIISHALDIFRK